MQRRTCGTVRHPKAIDMRRDAEDTPRNSPLPGTVLQKVTVGLETIPAQALQSLISDNHFEYMDGASTYIVQHLRLTRQCQLKQSTRRETLAEVGGLQRQKLNRVGGPFPSIPLLGKRRNNAKSFLRAGPDESNKVCSHIICKNKSI